MSNPYRCPTLNSGGNVIPQPPSQQSGEQNSFILNIPPPQPPQHSGAPPDHYTSPSFNRATRSQAREMLNAAVLAGGAARICAERQLSQQLAPHFPPRPLYPPENYQRLPPAVIDLGVVPGIGLTAPMLMPLNRQQLPP
jgi:hypothetical protein